MRTRLVLFVISGLLLTACFEVEQTYTLNPDGSGKVVHQVRRADIIGQGEDALPQMLQSQTGEASGVRAWSDVETFIDDDGFLVFRGVAYFDDLNTLGLVDGEALRFGWELDGSDGRLYLATRPGGDLGEAPPDLDQQVTKMRQEWNQSRAMMQGVIGGVSWKATFALPGTIERVSDLQRSGSTVSIEMNGSDYFEALDELMTSDDMLVAMVRSGWDDDSGEMPPMLMEKLYGDDGVFAALTVSAPLFDYDAESQTAAAAQEAMMADLGPAVEPAAPPAKGGALESARVIQASYTTDEKYSYGMVGGNITVLIEFPGSVTGAESGVLKVVRSSDGTDLLPTDGWRRELSVSFDPGEPTVARFDVPTMTPPPESNGFSEISGTVTYISAMGQDEEILLFDGLETGAAGNALGATIRSIEPGYSENTEVLDIELAIPREQLVEIRFLDSSGNLLETQDQGTSWYDESVTKSYYRDGTFPRDGRVVAVVRTDLQSFVTDFSVTDVDLLGRPR